MLSWDAQQIARHAGADLLVTAPGSGGPERISIDSRDAGPGVLFVGLPGASVHGGEFARQALDAGAWGVLPAHDVVAAAAGRPCCPPRIR